MTECEPGIVARRDCGPYGGVWPLGHKISASPGPGAFRVLRQEPWSGLAENFDAVTGAGLRDRAPRMIAIDNSF